jgi:hypothetical protein
VPDVAVAERRPRLIVRPLHPAVPCTLGLIEHRNKPDEPALEIVRKALLELRQQGGVASLDRDGPKRTRPARGSQS